MFKSFRKTISVTVDVDDQGGFEDELLILKFVLIGQHTLDFKFFYLTL